MMGILENGTVLWGSFQSSLSGEGGELHTMREDWEWGEDARRTNTEGGMGRAWEDALGPAP